MIERTRHISSSFDTALYGLKNDVLMMSSLTERIFQTAFEALLKRDSELCDHVVAEDEEIDILEKQVDQDGVNLLIRFSPRRIRHEGGCFCDEGQLKSGAYCGPIRFYREKSQTPEQQTGVEGTCLVGAALSLSSHDFS